MTQTEHRRTIFITGVAAGIGRATAELFSRRGWFVGGADIDGLGLDALSDTLGPDNCHMSCLDVTERNAWNAALDGFAAASGGRMDLFFNNAGIGFGGFFEDVPEDTAARIIAVNFQGVVNGIYACLPLLKATAAAHGKARIVNTGSASGIIGAPRLAVYAATKFAVRGLTDSLFVEFSRHNIEVTELQPWFVDTAILDTVEPVGNSGRDSLKTRNIEALPASLVADPARFGQVIARLLPNAMRKRLRKMMDEAVARTP
jgi:NAD(P)-dependent dehydrogenase (short-subunit alcohol dehydrogenase family)